MGVGRGWDGRQPKRRLAARAGAAVVTAVVAGSLAPGTSDAQVPGYQQLDPRSVRAEYTAEVLDRVNDIVAEWGQAWSTDDLDELLDQYWEDAILIPPGGTPLKGRDQLRGYFEEVLAQHGQVEAFLLDFDASGGLAMIFGNYSMGLQGAGGIQRGPLVTVYAMRGRSWRIRSQAFLPPVGD